MKCMSTAIAALAACLFTCAAGAATETVIYDFTGGNIAYSGAYPGAAVYLGADGVLYATASAGGCGGALHCGTMFQLTPPAAGQTGWTFLTDYFFCNDVAPPQGESCLLGNWPQAGLITDKAVDDSGSFYTTTEYGGTDNFGIVTKITPPAAGQTSWTGSVVWNFTNGVDGSYPLSGLITDAAGNLYGTAPTGGDFGNGTVYELSPPAAGQTSWTETTLWSFAGGFDGSYPVGGLIADKNGALYGTTYAGGGYASGSVFQMVPPAPGSTQWTENILWGFAGVVIEGADGAGPTGTLLMDSQGNLYGTTTAGGARQNYGTVFMLSPPAAGQTAWTETLLFSFSGDDGALPYGELIRDRVGRLYGTTYGGGIASNTSSGLGGVIFRLNPPAAGSTNWTETVLHKFTGGNGTGDGASPYANLVVGPDDTLYGTTAYGGGTACQPSYALGCGTVFQITGTGFKR